jgi:hypothetical protein
LENSGAFPASFDSVEGQATDVFVGYLKSLQYSTRKISNLFVKIETVILISVFVISAMASDIYRG